MTDTHDYSVKFCICCFRAMPLHRECSCYLGRDVCCFCSRCVGPSVGLHACSFPCARSNFFHFTPSACSDQTTYTNSGGLPISPSAAWSTESRSSNYSLHITTTSTMPPKNNNTSYQHKHNRSNTPVHANAGFAAKQRGENAAGRWQFAKNLTIKDPSRTMQTVGRATNTYITYDNKFEFRFWGSLENV